MKYALLVSYDGTLFAGFQRQKSQRTVQGVIERALSQIFHETITTVAAGRTDRNVHGLGQVMAFSSQNTRPLRALVDGTNSLLPPGVHIRRASLLEEQHTFHPRFQAEGRCYHYYLLSKASSDAHLFWGSRMWCIPQELNVALAQNSLPIFLGQHDFTTFTSRCDMPHHIRTIQSLELSEIPTPSLLPGELLRVSIKANGFLRKMVRLITAAIVGAGLGEYTSEELKQKLLAKDPSLASPPAPGQGLYFHSVTYPENPFKPGELCLQCCDSRTRGGPNFGG